MATPSIADLTPPSLKMSVVGFKDKLCNNLYSLWESSRFCDLTLSVCGGEIRTHSCLLAAFSPTIADILLELDVHFQEKGEDSRKYARVVVKDFSLEVMRSIVYSIYTGQLVTSPEMLGELLQASRWLKIQDLISLSEEAIEEHGLPAVQIPQINPQDQDEDSMSDIIMADEITENTSENNSCAKATDTPVPFSHNVSYSSDAYSNSKFQKSPLFPKHLQSSVSDCSSSEPVRSSFLESLNLEPAESSGDPFKLSNTTPNPSSAIIPSHVDTSPTNSSATVSGCSNATLPFPSSAVSEDASDAVRRGYRMRKKSQKWVESYLLGTGKDYLEQFTPLIKVEVDDLSTFLSSSEQLKRMHTEESELPPVFFGDNRSEVDSGINDISCDVGQGQNANDDLEVAGESQNAQRWNQSSDFYNTPRSAPTEHLRNPRQASTKSLSVFQERKKTPSLAGKRKRKKDASVQSKGCQTAGKERSSRDCSTAIVKNEYDDQQAHVLQQTDNQGATGDNVMPTIMKCQKCCVKFSDMDQYRDHLANHPVYYCEGCPAQFYRKDTLTRHHFNVHLNKKYLQCGECSFVAQSAVELCQHSTQEHNIPRPFRCTHPGCTFRANKYYAVDKHRRDIHEITEKKIICENCGRRFARPELLNLHLRACLRTEEHLCDLCGQAFNRREGMKYHREVTHFGIKKYKCKQCFKLFSSNGNLKRHMYIHNNTYPYSCPVCDKKFRHSNTLKGHMEVHCKKDGLAIDIPQALANLGLGVGGNYKRKCSSADTMPH